MATSEIRKKPLILIKRQTRKLSSLHAYSRIYYYKKLKPIVDADWTQYLAENPQLEKDDLRKESLRRRNLILKNLFDAETDEVKAEVEKKREDGLFSEDEDTEPDDDDLVDAIEQRRRAKALSFHRKVLLHI